MGLSEHPLFGKTGRALAVMLGVLAVPYAAPALRPLRIVPLPGEAPIHADDPPAPAPPPAVPGEQALPASENTPTVNNALPVDANPVALAVAPAVESVDRGEGRVKIEDPTGHALDAFFARLARTDRRMPGAITRILHYGDSTISSDYVSGTVRRRLQARFGDAGHGYILVANPWEWYFHNDVLHFSEGEWRASRLAGPTAPDGMYGLGGVTFTSTGGSATFGTASHGDYGRKASRYEIYYLEQPGGGDVEIDVRGIPPERFSTRGPEKASRVHTVTTDDGESRITVRAVGGGPARLFGVAIERDQPGVVYDALGSHAAQATFWQRQDRRHWQDQFALRDPALVILQYGTNESDVPKLNLAEYESALGALLDELGAIVSGASILVVAPLDRAEWRDGRIATRPIIEDIVAIQRRVALSHGAAFWNTFEAMGGEGSMARWVKARPQLSGDMTHPTVRGAEVLGNLLSDALVRAYEERASH